MSREEMIDEAVRRTVARYPGRKARLLRGWLYNYRIDQTALPSIIRNQFRNVCAEQGIPHA